jgi:hypothetical protein
MGYRYRGRGGPHFTGSARITVEYYYSVKYPLGSIAYDIYAAKQKGRIEPVVIKKYKINYNPYDVLYTDTLNALWNEEHLCSHSEAVEYAIGYYEKRQQMAESLLES